MPAVVPFSEPPYLLGLPSPYYTESHKAWQKACRAFFDEHFTPFCLEWEDDTEVPAGACLWSARASCQAAAQTSGTLLRKPTCSCPSCLALCVSARSRNRGLS
jgi:hypothetical protein